MQAGRFVLTDLAAPALAGDRRLERAGITECPVPKVRALDGSAIEVPGALPHLRWEAIDQRPPPMLGGRGRLVGLVVDGSGTAAGRHLGRLGARGHGAAWFTSLSHLADQGRVLPAADVASTRASIVELLAAAG